MSDGKLTSVPGPAPARTGGDEPPAEWPARVARPSRHGAISRRLFTYSNYKSWAEKMRTTWQVEEEDEEAAGEPSRVP